MSLIEQINDDIKKAMLAREKEKLEALRAVKAALLLAMTQEGSSGEVSDEAGMKLLQKLVKQRRDAAAIYSSQQREDLASVELAQASVIEVYLPKAMNPVELEAVLRSIIERSGATTQRDLGKVMGLASKELAGKADNKTISELVRKLLPS